MLMEKGETPVNESITGNKTTGTKRSIFSHSSLTVPLPPSVQTIFACMLSASSWDPPGSDCDRSAFAQRRGKCGAFLLRHVRYSAPEPENEDDVLEYWRTMRVPPSMEALFVEVDPQFDPDGVSVQCWGVGIFRRLKEGL